MSSGHTDESQYRAPALDKGLDVLESLAASRQARTQAQIARDLGRQPGEIFRTLATLERRGYLDRDPISGAYSLTMRLFALGQTHSPYEALVRVADRPMRLLTAETGHPCHLSVLHGGMVMVLHQVESSARVRISIAVGSTIAPAQSAAGRVLLAGMAAVQRAAILATDPDLTGAALADLEVHLGTIRTRGYEEARSETVEGLSDLSVRIGRPETDIAAALTLTALTRNHATFVRGTLAAMQACAAEISALAGLHAFTGEELERVR